MLRIKLEESQHIAQCYRILSSYAFARFTACLVDGVTEHCNRQVSARGCKPGIARRAIIPTAVGSLHGEVNLDNHRL